MAPLSCDKLVKLTEDAPPPATVPVPLVLSAACEMLRPLVRHFRRLAHLQHPGATFPHRDSRFLTTTFWEFLCTNMVILAIPTEI